MLMHDDNINGYIMLKKENIKSSTGEEKEEKTYILNISNYRFEKKKKKKVKKK